MPLNKETNQIQTLFCNQTRDFPSILDIKWQSHVQDRNDSTKREFLLGFNNYTLDKSFESKSARCPEDYCSDNMDN